MSLDDLQRIKRWHVSHRHTHPIENQAWDAILTLWVAGWVGWLPVIAFGLMWAVPLCVLGIAAPGMYVAWRLKAHYDRKLRCDWCAAATAR